MNRDELRHLLCTYTALKTAATPLYRIPYPSDFFRGFQGGCSDGSRYYYQVLMHYELSDRTMDRSCIARVDLKTHEAQYSETLDLGHANDMTYHPGKHLLIVAENKPDPYKVYFVDPDTLTVIGEKRLDVPIYAIEYNAARDRYLVGLSGTREFCFLDSEMRPIGCKTYRTTPETDRYTKQGICADDRFLYFILWDGKHKELPDFQNLVAVYGWDGTFCGYLHFDVGPSEPESISIVNGEILAVAVADHSPMIYRFTPILP